MIQAGDICRTNCSQPGGLVKVLQLAPTNSMQKTMAWIEHIEDHPYGYEKGTRGWYYLEYLVFVERPAKIES